MLSSSGSRHWVSPMHLAAQIEIKSVNALHARCHPHASHCWPRTDAGSRLPPVRARPRCHLGLSCNQNRNQNQTQSRGPGISPGQSLHKSGTSVDGARGCRRTMRNMILSSGPLAKAPGNPSSAEPQLNRLVWLQQALKSHSADARWGLGRRDADSTLSCRQTQTMASCCKGVIVFFVSTWGSGVWNW